MDAYTARKQSDMKNNLMDYSSVLVRIKTAVKKGQYNVTLPGGISSEASIKLAEAGYQIEGKTISW